MRPVSPSRGLQCGDALAVLRLGVVVVLLAQAERGRDLAQEIRFGRGDDAVGGGEVHEHLEHFAAKLAITELAELKAGSYAIVSICADGGLGTIALLRKPK